MSACSGQKIETVDMPRSEALASGQTTLGELRTTMHDDFRNKLIWGDNKLVMASLQKAELFDQSCCVDNLNAKISPPEEKLEKAFILVLA